MPIAAGDIKFRLSGGASNSDQNASLGGVKSSNEITSALFDVVGSAEAASGDVEYRCFYVHNAHPTLTMLSAVLWLLSNTPSSSTSVDVGVGTSAVNGTEQTVANENTAPSGVTFSAAASEGAALALGDIPPGQHRAVWIRRTVNTGVTAYTGDGFGFRVKCDTLA